jgi:DNA polymerase-3 subunit gamma/tau
MSYQVIARRWRPQRFDDVIAQPVVTRTLRHAIEQGRIAHAFVFAGPRGVGKTTTARILARALNCVKGPTADPCGVCEPCVEIAEGRDMDVLEIDAATHTGVDNVREVIVAGLSIPPMRDRFKVFIIDEVHQLSASSFNALLKSIEEPPPHVVFMMATTELHKIPETVLSRSQLFEFRTIATRTIAEQLRRIADAEGIAIDDPAVQLIARAAEGSMRDAQSALDQVIAFAGKTVTGDDVSTVLGLVGRELILQIVEAVAAQDAQAAFGLVNRAVEDGHDLIRLCRELSFVIRDLLVIAVDPSRLADPDIAAEAERPRLEALASTFSREDLMRAFDLIARAEMDMRSAPQPQYHLEMALLRWMHLRKLVPIEDLIAQVEASAGRPPSAPGPSRAPRATQSTAPATPSLVDKVLGAKAAALPPSPAGAKPAPMAKPAEPQTVSKPDPPPPGPARPAAADPPTSSPAAGDIRPAFLAEIQKGKPTFYAMVVAQALRIDFDGDTITFAFSATHRMLRDQLEQNRPWLEGLAARVSGRRMSVTSVQADGPAAGPAPEAPKDRKAPDLKAEALANPGVQALLEMFPAEIRDVEEL